VLASHDWHPGIVGLVAARLKERYGRPVFAFASKPDGTVTGSGRSIPGVDLGRAVRAAVTCGHAVKGGGHAMAAGVTLEAANIGAFQAFLDATLSAAVAAARTDAALPIDAVLTARGLTGDLVDALDQAGPYGSGNPEPIVVFPAHRLKAAQPVGTDHLRLTLEAGDGAALSAIAFRAGGRPLGEGLRAAIGRPVHVAGNLARSRLGGAGRAELRVLDAALA
jgi:single-stranded-DNA-specific exonuclease